MKDVKLMKGNEAIALGAVNAGCDGYFGYPITPQSEIIETLMEMKPWETTGMAVLQAESEIASINMVYGAAAMGKKAMTTSSSPGISLCSEGLSYIAGAELPCVVVNVQRGGPGLGTIQPAQADYAQAVKAPGHGDFNLIVLAPNSVQEMYDHVFLAYELAFKYRNPAMILTDGVIGQMMEKLVVDEAKPRMTEEFIRENYGSWALVGNKGVVTSLELEASRQEKVNERIQAKYKALKENEVRVEMTDCDDAEFVIVAFGSSARIAAKSVEILRAEGIKAGLLRPITLFPFPDKQLQDLAAKGVKGFLVAELNAGQMVKDVRLAVNGARPVEYYGRMGGMIYSPGEIAEALKEKLIEKTK
ncbi:MAG: 3-methyl-2-oxobutanoate dehydrogenase subunit VorB [Rikenellaceae bacterium]|nr:3-methyl-2-oxobutanoate dehydrogenase subunit VorB [Rikenellaceae bacterium]MCL2692358.1 3-methyl-2-oxobutanoate dehydrogenase subunit VorB [Rikenellaceae bacterium]